MVLKNVCVHFSNKTDQENVRSCLHCWMLISEGLLYKVAVFRVATDLATCGLPLLELKTCIQYRIAFQYNGRNVCGCKDWHTTLQVARTRHEWTLLVYQRGGPVAHYLKLYTPT